MGTLAQVMSPVGAEAGVAGIAGVIGGVVVVVVMRRSWPAQPLAS